MRNRITLEMLKRMRGYVLVFAFIVSTFIETLVHWHGPPDVVLMSIMAVSMYLLFEIGLLCARFLPKR